MQQNRVIEESLKTERKPNCILEEATQKDP